MAEGGSHTDPPPALTPDTSGRQGVTLLVGLLVPAAKWMLC